MLTLQMHICFLQEARLSLLPSKECGSPRNRKTLKVNTRIEICAANKVFRRIDAYRRVPYHISK